MATTGYSTSNAPTPSLERETALGSLRTKLSISLKQLQGINGNLASILADIYGEGGKDASGQTRPIAAGILGSVNGNADDIHDELERLETFVNRLRSLA